MASDNGDIELRTESSDKESLLESIEQLKTMGEIIQFIEALPTSPAKNFKKILDILVEKKIPPLEIFHFSCIYFAGNAELLPIREEAKSAIIIMYLVELESYKEEIKAL